MNRRTLVVLGMHRSGTSMLAQCCHLLGAQLASQIIGAEVAVNRDGFFEDAKVVALNDELLAMLGSGWHDFSPLTHDAIQAPDIKCWQDHALDYLRQEYADNSLSVMKDPRLSRLWRYWAPLFRQAGLGVDIAQIVRQPEQVAWSLKHRDAMPVAYGVLLWCAHVTDTLAAMCDDAPWTTFFYDAFTADPGQHIQLLRSVLGSASDDETNFADIASTIGKPRNLSASLSDNSLVQYQPLADYAARLYQQLEKHCINGKLEIAKPDAQRLVDEYHQLLCSHDGEFQALREFTRELMSLSGKLVEIGELHSRAQQIVAQRDAQLDELNGALARVGAELRHAQTVVVERDAQLARYESKWFRRVWRRLFS